MVFAAASFAAVDPGGGAPASQPRKASPPKQSPGKAAPGVKGKPAPSKPGDTPPPIVEALDALEGSRDFKAAESALQRHFDSVVASAPERDPAPFREAALALRMVRLCAAAPSASRIDLLKYLRANKPLASAVAFVLDAETDDLACAAALLDRLRKERAERASRLPGMTAALVAVRDQPLELHINENAVTAPDPVALFDYFAESEGSMALSLSAGAPELLAFVVDAACQPDDLRWAARRFPENRDVGQRFFDVRYDWDHYRSGAKKKVSSAGFTLPNIMQYGGVCADQAYFACGVGKALGVPTVYVVANSAEVGHAWVGYLQMRNRGAVWDFNEGRYDAYKWIKGNIREPRSGETVSDAEVGMTAALAATPADRREASAALVDASMRLLADWKPPTDEPGAGDARSAKRTGKPEEALALLEAAVNLSPGNVRAWRAMTAVAHTGKMTNEQKARWTSALQKTCGAEFPDFMIEMLHPLIDSMRSLDDQARAWEGLSRDMARRPDLAADALISLGAVREKQGDTAGALAAYEEVVNRFAHVGLFIVRALDESRRVLKAGNRQSDVPALMEAAWRKVPKPDMAGYFWGGSSWFRVGLLYAAALHDDGRKDEAQRVLGSLGIKAGLPG